MTIENTASVSYRAGSLLAIETTGPVCSVALMTADDRVFYRASEEGLMHLTSLIPMIEALLAEAGLKPRQIGRIAVSAGPGSFTGIRIGIATARALAQTLRVPIVKVPTLETFVYNQWNANHGDGPFDRQASAGHGDGSAVPLQRDGSSGEPRFAVACPIFDARRDQMYAGAYMLEEDGRIMTLMNGGAHDPEVFFSSLTASLSALIKLASRASGPEAKVFCRLFGDGLPVFREAAEKFVSGTAAPGLEIVRHPETQDARAVLAWAVKHGAPEGYETLEPIYYRKAEAQRRLDERNAADQGDRPFDRPGPLPVGLSKGPPPCHIRQADENDVYGISVIERLSFGEPWLEQSILSDLRLEYSDYVVCEDEGFMLGYAGLHLILDEGHITNIAVHPGARRLGIGGALLTELLNRAGARGVTAFTLEVRDSDEAATSFYEKHGFAAEGLRKDYYPAADGGREDARLMWRRCPEGEK